MSPARVWLILAVAYGAFFSWYTSFGGPLTSDEIAGYVAALERAGQPPEAIEDIRGFLENDTGDDFVILNIVDSREPPLVVEGFPPAADAQEMSDRYMEFMYPALFARACHPVMVGAAAHRALDLMGLDVERIDVWDQGVLMRYRSRRDLMDILSNPAFAGRHEFKVAAIEKTIAFPLDPWFQLGDPRLVLGLVFGMIGFARQSLRRDGEAPISA